MIRIFHIAGEMSHGVPFELLVVGPPEDSVIEDYAPSHCKVDVMQEITLEGNWPGIPSDTTFDRHWD